MAGWGISQAQAVWWPISGAADVVAMLEAATGGDLTSFQKVQGTAIAVRTEGSISYRLQFAQGRLDLFVLPPDNTADFPILFDVDKTVAAFKTIAHKLLDQVGVSTRLAVSLTTIKPVKDESEAVALLSEQVGVELPYKDGIDFVFQINRRTNMAGIAINRLLKMESHFLRLMRLENGVPLPSIDGYFALLNADVNTVLEPSSKFEVSEQKELFDKLLVEAQRLSAAKTLRALG